MGIAQLLECQTEIGEIWGWIPNAGNLMVMFDPCLWPDDLKVTHSPAMCNIIYLSLKSQCPQSVQVEINTEHSTCIEL